MIYATTIFFLSYVATELKFSIAHSIIISAMGYRRARVSGIKFTVRAARVRLA
nr:hypothetical protein [uncultured Campylobacter sp.]